MLAIFFFLERFVFIFLHACSLLANQQLGRDLSGSHHLSSCNIIPGHSCLTTLN